MMIFQWIFSHEYFLTKNFHHIQRVLIFNLHIGQAHQQLTKERSPIKSPPWINSLMSSLLLIHYAFFFFRFASLQEVWSYCLTPSPRNHPGASQDTAINWRLKDLQSPLQTSIQTPLRPPKLLISRKKSNFWGYPQYLNWSLPMFLFIDEIPTLVLFDKVLLVHKDFCILLSYFIYHFILNWKIQWSWVIVTKFDSWFCSWIDLF